MAALDLVREGAFQVAATRGIGRRRPDIDEARPRLGAADLEQNPHQFQVCAWSIRLETRRSTQAKREQVTAQTALPPGVGVDLTGLERGARTHAIGAACNAIELARTDAVGGARVERPHVLENARRDVGFVQARA